MFLLRSMFWIGVVMLMVPRGPDLSFDLGQVRTAISADPAATQSALSDLVQAGRKELLARLATVDADIKADKARRGEQPRDIASFIPREFHK